MFVIRFGSEGDWKHALHNGPWQFDFNVVMLKDFDGDTRPSQMIFDTIESWVHVTDLPLDKRCKAFGGKHLRVRAKISLYEPLVRGFFLKTSGRGGHMV